MNPDPRALLAGQVFAMAPAAFHQMEARLRLRAEGLPITAADLRSPQRHTSARLRVLALQGLLMPRSSFLLELFGGTALDRFRAQLAAAVEDASVDEILIAVDSPGGAVAGVPETAEAIRRAAKVKPVIASTLAMNASAAFWISAQASTLLVGPSSEIGSVGVFAVHDDYSRANDQLGLTVTYVVSAASPFKVELNSDEPLSETARTYEQTRVDEVAGQFLRDLALGRRTTASKVAKSFGQGRTVGAAAALQRGMADRVEAFDDALARLASSAAGAGRRASADDELELELIAADMEMAQVAMRAVRDEDVEHLELEAEYQRLIVQETT